MPKWTDAHRIKPTENLAEGFPDGWYARTLTNDTRYPTLKGVHQAETVVIGAGLAGINTALGLVERGRDVMLLEAKRVGFGASGRNGGFLSAGFARGMSSIAARTGPDTADALYNLSRGAVDETIRRINRHDINCGPVVEGIVRASWFRDGDALRREADQSEGLDYWDRTTVEDRLGTHRYHGAIFEKNAYCLHPLNLTRGLAAATRREGAQVFERSPAESLHRLRDGRYRVTTRKGEIIADTVVLCMSGYRPFMGGGSGSRGGAAILPITTFVMVTEPLGDLAYEAISIPNGISDTRFACDYYRPLPDTGGRILWGGRISTFRPDDAGVARLMKRDMVRVYPMLKDARVDFAWSGLMGYACHKMPVVMPLAPGLWSCTGFGGHGLNTTLMAGDLVAAAIAEGDDRYRLLEAFGPIPLPRLGGLIGAQLTYWWHDWKDELRIATGS